MDISRAGTARAAAAADQRLGAVDRTAAALLRTGLFTRAAPAADDGKTKTDDDLDAVGQTEDASSSDKKSDNDDTKVDAKSDKDAKDDAAEDREEEKASDKKEQPNSIDREPPPVKDKDSLDNDDLDQTPWDDDKRDEKREISPPIDEDADDSPVQHAKTGPAAEDTLPDMLSREFSYNFTTDADDKIPQPIAQKSSDDHNYQKTISDVSFDSDEDEQRGLLDGGDNEPGALPSGDATDVDDVDRGHFDGGDNEPGALPSGAATPIEDLEKSRSADDDDETVSTPSGAMAGVPAS